MPVDVMLTETDHDALQRWAQRTGIGTSVTDVEPLTGGSQNIVVRLRIDGRPMVLRRPPRHPHRSGVSCVAGGRTSAAQYTGGLRGPEGR